MGAPRWSKGLLMAMVSLSLAAACTNSTALSGGATGGFGPSGGAGGGPLSPPDATWPDCSLRERPSLTHALSVVADNGAPWPPGEFLLTMGAATSDGWSAQVRGRSEEGDGQLALIRDKEGVLAGVPPGAVVSLRVTETCHPWAGCLRTLGVKDAASGAALYGEFDSLAAGLPDFSRFLGIAMAVAEPVCDVGMICGGHTNDHAFRIADTLLVPGDGVVATIAGASYRVTFIRAFATSEGDSCLDAEALWPSRTTLSFARL